MPKIIFQPLMIANPSGRLTEDNPYCISKIPIQLEKAGWGFCLSYTAI